MNEWSEALTSLCWLHMSCVASVCFHWNMLKSNDGSDFGSTGTLLVSQSIDWKFFTMLFPNELSVSQRYVGWMTTTNQQRQTVGSWLVVFHGCQEMALLLDRVLLVVSRALLRSTLQTQTLLPSLPSSHSVLQFSIWQISLINTMFPSSVSHLNLFSAAPLCSCFSFNAYFPPLWQCCFSVK